MKKRVRQVAALTGDGRIVRIEQDVPALATGAIRVEVHASLVSPGTELGGWHALRSRREAPKTGVAPKPFGYSNAGRVLAVGEGVTDFRPGDRVACIGAKYAQHADLADVPHRLCAALPEGVTYAQGSYAMLAATGMQAVRRGEPALGEYVAVAGLGIVGLLTARLYRLAGAYVIGWDTIPLRVKRALAGCADAAALVGRDDECEATKAFTRGAGLDAAVLAFGGEADRAVASLEACMKRAPDGHPMGRMVVVGGLRFAYTSTMTNIDVRRSSRTGPGYHDEDWEFGRSDDYPPVFLRWTTRTHLDLCLRLMAEGRLEVDGLTTHRIPFENVENGVEALLEDPDAALGVVFEMRKDEA